ncbi:MAG: hypothetical protein IAE79_05215 [Anaerolinea sp.]|nr:hypothetical protein [Anaerolinea sp.]
MINLQLAGNGKRNSVKLPALLLLLICLLSGAGVWLSGTAQGRTLAQPQSGTNGITEPASGETIAGVVVVVGTAVDPNYLRYELAFRPEAGAAADWIVFAEGEQRVVNGRLAIWDTTVGRSANAPVWPDGRYQLRLRVVRADYNYSEYFVTGLIISNDGTPTPTATPTITGTAVAPVTPVVGTPANGAPAFAPLTPIPSLTPFPTPTPLPLPLNEEGLGGVAAAPDAPRGLFGQVQQVDASPLARAFWQGVRITAYLFLALLLYLIVRAIGRWLWQFAWRKLQSRDTYSEQEFRNTEIHRGDTEVHGEKEGY